MSNITELKELIGKAWRLKPTLNKGTYMANNFSPAVSSSDSGKTLCTYYYGEEAKSGTALMFDQNLAGGFKLGGTTLYNFSTNKYEGSFGNKPRIIIFNPELTEEDLKAYGYVSSGGPSAEGYFISWWNGNTEEISLADVLTELGDSIRAVAGTSDPIALLAMSYKLEKAMKDYTKPSGHIDITNANTFDVSKYKTASVNDPNLKPELIAEGYSILGIPGTHKGNSGVDTTDATATSNDILPGKSAYINNTKVEGTMAIYDYSFVTGYLEDAGITQEQTEALNNIQVALTDELTITYDETVLDMNFYIENENLVCENNMEDVTMQINSNGELEVTY